MVIVVAFAGTIPKAPNPMPRLRMAAPGPPHYETVFKKRTLFSSLSRKPSFSVNGVNGTCHRSRILIEADRPQQLPPSFFKGSAMIFPPTLVEDAAAHDQHPSAEPSRQCPVPRRCGPETTNRLDLRKRKSD